MRHADTVDKIVQVYLGGLCRHTFTYKGKNFTPKEVVVSPLLLRGFTCPTQCGACCGSFSLDFLPSEACSPRAVPRLIELDDQKVALISDLQEGVPDRWCRHLSRASGRCSIYERRPFACDFELIRLLMFDHKVVVTQKQYGRFWAMERLDGERGASCTMLPPSERTIAEVARKFDRLLAWASHCHVETCVPQILEWIRMGDHSLPLRLPV
jgi:hypothetical protein